MHHYVGFWQIGSHMCVCSIDSVDTDTLIYEDIRCIDVTRICIDMN